MVTRLTTGGSGTPNDTTRGINSLCGVTVSDIGLGRRKITPVGTRLRTVSTLRSGNRVCACVTRVRGGKVGPCFDLCVNTSSVGDSVGLIRACRKNVKVKRHSCCLRGSRRAGGVHSGCRRRVTGVFRLTNCSRTTTRGTMGTIVGVRAHLTGSTHSRMRLHSPRTGCGGVSVRALGGGFPAFT